MADDEAHITAELMRGRLDEFVTARAKAERRLRQEGHRELAARIAALRKPSVGLWALNQAGTTAPADLDALRRSGIDLRRAQEALLGGKRDGAAQLQRATQGQRRHLDVVTRRLGMVLEGAGHAASAETMRRVSDGLRTASVGDEDTWSALRDGQLLEEPAHSGFPDMDVTLQQRVAEDRVERDDEDQLRRLEAAEAEVRRAESVEQAAREQEEMARQRLQEATRALDNARAALAEWRRRRGGSR